MLQSVLEVTKKLQTRAWVQDAARGLSYEVEILDAKAGYGTTRYKVKPVNGTGEAWVEERNLRTK